jgi:hypothetical protein
MGRQPSECAVQSSQVFLVGFGMSDKIVNVYYDLWDAFNDLFD